MMTASPLTVRLEEDALPNTESPPTVSPPVVEALLEVITPPEEMLNHDTPVEEATVKSEAVGLLEVPCTVRSDVGDVDPIPTLPFEMIEKSEVPEEDATLNGFCVAPAWMLKVIPDDVAPTPAITPVSRRRPVVSEVPDVQRARKSVTPPERNPS